MISEGSRAPAFRLPDQNNKIHDLKEYAGKWLVLYFYPKDLTPGCTTEACDFRDSFSVFKTKNIAILGVSKDSVSKHAKFARKYDLPFPLLSDENNTVCEDYGVWQEKSLYGKKYMGIMRTTFIIGPGGKIVRIYPKVDVKKHINEIIQDLQNLQN
jgi:peroxiredoxin Q/BCP